MQMNLPNSISIVDVSKKSFQFDTLEVLTDFIKTELNFWKNKDTKQKEDGLFVHSYLNYHNNFQAALNIIEGWSPSLSTWEVTVFAGEVNSLFRNYLNPISNQWLWSGHVFIEPWLKSYKLSQASGDSFIQAIVNKDTRNITIYDCMQGYLLAYEFLMQDETQLTQRRHAEKVTFSSIRQQLISKKDALIKDVSNYQVEIEKWKTKTIEETEDWHDKHIRHIDATSIKHSKDFQDRISAWTAKVTDLETLYQEKLRFESSANYWALSANKFRKQGFYWTLALVLTAAVAILYLSNFFVSWLQGYETAIKLNSIQGVILFASILSAFAILIRTFSKLTFSAFHLQRDAEEREQLTHLYLALGNETEVDSDSRKIILQSLFSRSETGLLANESGPMMPSVNDIVSVASRRGS
jgi:hypothetical protein